MPRKPRPSRAALALAARVECGLLAPRDAYLAHHGATASQDAALDWLREVRADEAWEAALAREVERLRPAVAGRQEVLARVSRLLRESADEGVVLKAAAMLLARLEAVEPEARPAPEMPPIPDALLEALDRLR